MLPDVPVFDDDGRLVHDAVLSDEQIADLRVAHGETCLACGGPDHEGVCVDEQGYVLPEFARRAKTGRHQELSKLYQHEAHVTSLTDGRDWWDFDTLISERELAVFGKPGHAHGLTACYLVAAEDALDFERLVAENGCTVEWQS